MDLTRLPYFPSGDGYKKSLIKNGGLYKQLSEIQFMEQ